MKVIQLFKIYLPDNGGGIAAVMKNISNILQGEEQEIIVCHGQSGKKTVIEKRRGVIIRRCRQLFSVASTPFSLSFFLQTFQAAKGADLAIIHFPYPLADLALLLRVYKGKYVVWWHCDIDRFKGLLSAYKPLMRRTLQNADKIIVSSEGMMKDSPFLREFKETCVVIPFGLDSRMITKADKYLQKPFRENSACKILFIGRLVWYKGCGVLMEAMAKLEREGCLCELTMIGDGPLKGSLQETAKKLGLHSVRFAGKVTESQKIKYIEECDFLVVPSTSKAESFAIVQLEAMVFGKPVINTNIPGGVPCVSIDGETGITVEPGDAGQLAEAIKRLTADVGLRKQYGRRAAEIVRQRYTEKQMAEKIRTLFRTIAGE